MSADSLCYPTGVAVDGAGNLYVAENGHYLHDRVSNHRVLEYDTPLTSDTTADRVFGQGGSFSGFAFCNKGGVSANSLCCPGGVAVDGAGNLYIADAGNHRVLEYNGPLSVCGNGLIESGEACDDGNTVNGDCCSSTCQLEPEGTACDDGNSCTYNDTCNSSGQCVGTAIICTSDQCNTRACNGTSTCTVTPLTGNTCNDGNACTENDTCESGTCTGRRVRNGTPCDDGNPCTRGERCRRGVCTGTCNVGALCGSGSSGRLRCLPSGSACSCR